MPIIIEFLILLAAFMAWCISWGGYICGKYSLTGDAFIAYWDDRIFLDNIRHGVYPLWNPGYHGGVPWNFFLRRMGEINPFYWIVNILRTLGVPAVGSHLIFLLFYYFLGIIGFWLLARLFLKHSFTAMGACLLLLFSWGTQLFYCFELLELVPLVWFFYFLLSFAHQGKKHQFLGIWFTLGLLISTYVPFFALTIIACIGIFICLLFSKETLDFFKTTARFVVKEKVFTALSLSFFLMASLLMVDFYVESQKGGFVMPIRHLGSSDPSAVAVATANANQTQGIAYSRIEWDIIAYGNFDKVFADQKNMALSDFNIALLIFIIPLMAIINPISRRTALLMFPAALLVLMNITHGCLRPFLLEHVFFYHYLRMLQLFLWLGVLPLVILMVMEQLRVFIINQQGRRNIPILVFTLIVHGGIFWWLLNQQGVSWGSYVALVCSLLFFVFIILGIRQKAVLVCVMACGLMVQPLCFAHYIEHNSALSYKGYASDQVSYFIKSFGLLHQGDPIIPQKQDPLKATPRAIIASGYYENPWLNELRQNIDDSIIAQFEEDKLLLYDNTVVDDKVSYQALGKMMSSLGNKVFISRKDSSPEDFKMLAPGLHQAQVIYEESPQIKVLAYDANTLKLRSNLDHQQFLLWANGYHPGWKVYIDGRESKVLRADFAFKGLWLPEGVHTIVFRYLSTWAYVVRIFILIAFAFVLCMMVFLGIREGLLINEGFESGN